MEIKRYKDESDSYSRYQKLDRIKYDTGEEIIETSDRIEIEYDPSDEYIVVTPGFENRLDLISYKYYGTSKYWWVIASANNIYNPFDVPLDMTLRIPDIGRV